MNSTKICQACSKEFKKPYYKSLKNWEKMIYCSLKCFGKAMSNQITIKCAYCSIELSVKASVNKKTKRKFCSKKCYHLYRSEMLPKEEQPRFGHGHPVEERKHRAKARSILNHYLRDNNIERPVCEVCGNSKSEAHHEDYNNPLDVKWLCFKHHREAHKETPNC